MELPAVEAPGMSPPDTLTQGWPTHCFWKRRSRDQVVPIWPGTRCPQDAHSAARRAAGRGRQRPPPRARQVRSGVLEVQRAADQGLLYSLSDTSELTTTSSGARQHPSLRHLPLRGAELPPCLSDSHPWLALPEVPKTWLPSPSAHLGSLGLLDTRAGRATACRVGMGPSTLHLLGISSGSAWIHVVVRGSWVPLLEAGVHGLIWKARDPASAQRFLQRL